MKATKGLAKVLSDYVPIFFGLRGLIATQHKRNRTIFALSRHPEKADRTVEKLRAVFHDFEKACSGVAL